MPKASKVVARLALSGASVFAVLLAAGPGWAQTAAPTAQGSGGTQPAEAPISQSTASQPADDGQGGASDELVVTGTSIRGVPPTGSNLISVSRQDIATIGAATTADLLATVPQLNSFNTAPRAGGGGFGAFAPGLRGLPSTATLVLMNGHRLVGAAATDTNPDYPNIPDLALQRIEIVADGASSIYGSDAIAGVVNFITRKPFNGAEGSVRYGGGDDYDAFNASALVGHDWGTGSVLLAYEYSQNSNITGGDRDYRTQDFRPFGGVDTRAFNCPSANVLIGATVYAAPNFAPNTINYCDNNAPVDLLPKSRLHSGFLSLRQDVGDRVTLWGDLVYSDRLDRISAAPPVETLTIFNTNPFFVTPPGTNATFETVLFRTDNLFGADHLENRDRTRIGNSSAGADVRLPRDFKLSVYGTYDWAKNSAFIPAVDPVALAAAAAGTTPQTALDPFGDGTAPDVAAAITDYPTAVDIDQRTYLAATKIDGPLADLPGGQLKVAAGAEYRRETFSQRGFVGASPVPEDLKRNIYALYGEVYAPIFGEGNALPGLRRLDLSLSARYDHYSDFGSTTNPKVGVDWSPVDGVTVRGTYGTSFRAPGMRQVGATVGAYYLPASVAGIIAFDPTRGANQVDTIELIGGNHDLKPEKAKTWSVGFDLAPKTLPNFHAGLTYYNIHFTDAIGTPPISLVFTDPTFAGNVYRNPSAAQLASLLGLAVPENLPTPLPAIGNVLDLRLGNFGVRDTDGLDFDVSYRWPTGFGAVFAGVAGNYILDYKTQLTPGTPSSNSLDLGVPRATFRATAGVTAGPISAATFVNYTDGITNTYNTPTGTAPFNADSYVTVDLRLTWTAPNTGWTKGTLVTLQVDDLFDQTPPFFPGTDGIAGAYNPIGRFVGVNVRKSF